MHEAIAQMMQKYRIRSLDDSLRAIREIIQEIALLGLWRAKFFDKAALYGGTGLRVLYGLDRFSEDLDFSLLRPTDDFNLSEFTGSLEREIAAFGFSFRAEITEKSVATPVKSAFLKADTKKQLLVIKTEEDIIKLIPRGSAVKIRLEVDADPPGGFSTETRFLLLPIPFGVRTFSLPDYFAGKMHAALCRRWKSRVKGRDWYDFVWFVAHHPELHLAHLEQRMRQTHHWESREALTEKAFHSILYESIHKLDVQQAKKEVFPFVKSPEILDIWSTEFFLDVAQKIKLV